MLNEASPPGPPTLEQAIAAHQAGRLTEAEGLYRAFLRAFPDHPAANHNLGILLAQRGRADLGASYLKRATEAAPGQVYHWISYAEALAAAGRSEEAGQVLETARSRGLGGAGLEHAFARMMPSPGAEAGRLLQEAVRFHQSGQLEKAAQTYRQILSRHPNLPEVHCNLGSVLKATGEIAEAKAAFERAIALAPTMASAHFNLGNLFREQGNWKAAAGSYRNAVNSQANFAEAHNNLGLVFLAMCKPEDATVCFQRATELGGFFPSAYNNLGNALHQTGKTGEAVIAFKTALRQDPDHAEALNGLGALLGELEKHQEAEEHLRRALALRPEYVEAHNNLANLLAKRGDAALSDAIHHYEVALSLNPDFIEAYDHLGLALCKAYRVPDGFAWFTRGAHRRSVRSSRDRSPHQRSHDREQVAYRNRIGLGEKPGLQIEGGQTLPAPVVNQRAGAEAEWHSASPQILVIDDLLTDKALTELRRFCLASTIWSESFEDGYLGARPESGFASPLLAQIADELRAVYPAIFRDYPLLYTWSFKYDNRLKGTKIHADFAAVNVNFWVTPDEANLDPEGGGLVVWDVAAPLDWDFARYNRDEKAIRKFLGESQARAVRIPYRANRVVIFDSDLFHETDAMTFADGYENRRINITLLYGDRKTAES